jgi:hypothetical protein
LSFFFLFSLSLSLSLAITEGREIPITERKKNGRFSSVARCGSGWNILLAYFIFISEFNSKA